MAGYIGTKAVLLSTTAASVTGNADIGGDLTVGSNALFVDQSTGDISFYEDTGTTPKFFWDASAEVLGVGTATPNVFANTGMHIHDATTSRLHMTNGTTGSASSDGWEMQAFEDDFYILGREAAGDIIMYPNNSEAMRITSDGSVGIGTSSPAATLEISNATSNAAKLRIARSTTLTNYLELGTSGGSSTFTAQGVAGIHGDFSFFTKPSDGSATQRMRLDPSGNLLVGKTSSSLSTAGAELRSGGAITGTVSGGVVAALNRLTSDGNILTFNKDGATVGSIGTGYASCLYIGDQTSGLASTYILFCNGSVRPATSSGAQNDNALDMGDAAARWDDIYATNGTIQTSDANEKQDIAEMDEAERRVAVAAKGLLRKFRWKDAVAEKGDDARIHFGIIAQDLQAAFAAEGLDAGRYAMFISSTWWEADRVIPAVEAQDAVYETQLDEDGNEVQVLVSDAVEAQPEQVVTDTYETQAEAPEGAVERTRLGVRYPELLAFIIGAM